MDVFKTGLKLASSFSRNSITEKSVGVKVHRIFKKHIGFSSDTYEKLATASEGQVLGSLPSDIMMAVKNQGAENRSSIIKRITDGFRKAVEDLSSFAKLEIEKKKHVLSDNEALLKAKEQVIANLYYIPDMSQEAMPILQSAGTKLVQALKGILPETCAVSVQGLGSGRNGDVFKIGFFDVFTKKKYFDDIVIKTYKSKADILELETLNQLLSNRINSKMSDMELKSLIVKRFKQRNLSDAEIQKYITEQFENERQLLPKITVDEIKQNLSSTFQQASAFHGCMPEANAAQYIRYNAGQKITNANDVVVPYMFGLGKAPFSVSRFVSADMPAPTKRGLFWKIGLSHGDVAQNEANMVAGRIIDLGGIVKSYGDKLDNKISIRYFKKIIQQSQSREDMPRVIELYKKEAESVSDLTLRDKINKAVSATEDFLKIFPA